MKNNITIFIVFSLVSHLIVGLWWITQPIDKVPFESSNELSVHINKSNINNPIKQSERKKSEKQNKIIRKEAPSKAPKPNKPINQEKTKSESILQTTSNSNSSVSRAKVIAQIKNKLNKNFYYPRLAQRKNWQGKVILAFLVNTSGKISHIKVAHSSGFSVLDNAALKAMSKVEYLTSISLNKEMNIQLPVIYKLFEG